MRILLIVSGSIAAYKALELIRLMRKENHNVRAILTKGGAKFITPLSVSSLTGSETYTDLFFLKDEVDMGHIRLSREADLIVVAPASADIIAKMAHGLADDLATAALLASSAPILVAPAMNAKMWGHPATQRNIKQLEADGVAIIAPGAGDLACGELGEGRMAEPEEIKKAIGYRLSVIGKESALLTTENRQLITRKAIVTAGPTQEPIDTVRYIANHSSGKQGYAIAQALADAGAEVTLITGPTSLPPPNVSRMIQVTTANQMHEAVMRALPADIGVFTAAVADWTPAKPAAQKLKKRANQSPPAIALTETRDILADVSRHKKRPALLIGFAAETDNLMENARKKLQRKDCDWLLANDVSKGRIFGEDNTELLFVTAKGATAWPKMSKQEAAGKLVQEIVTSSLRGALATKQSSGAVRRDKNLSRRRRGAAGLPRRPSAFSQ